MDSPLTVTLWIVGYLAVGFLGAALGSRFDDSTELSVDTLMFICVLWPVALACGLIYGFFIGLGKLFELISGGTRITADD